MIALVEKVLEDVKNRVRLMVGRCIIAAVNGGGTIQVAQVNLMADETIDDIPIIQQYGFSSGPLPGSEAVAVFLGGQRDNGVIIATDDRRYRIKVLNGEVAIYTDEGDSIHLKRGRVMEMTTQTLNINATTAVNFNTPMITTNGAIRAQLDIRDNYLSAGSKTMANMRLIYNGHQHNENNTAGPTNIPNQLM